MKKNKGITLIALVITIVILLILAVISINAIVGENGILARAQKSRMESLIAKEKEQIEIAYNNLKANNIITGEEITDENLKLELEKNGNNMKSVVTEPDGFLIIFADTENEHKLNPETGEVILSKAGNGYSSGGAGSSSGSNGTYYASATSTTAKDDASSSIVPAVNPKFAVYDGLNGNKLDGFDSLFDKDLSTGITRYSYQTIYIKWEGDISGRLLQVTSNFGPNGSRALRYLDKDGNILRCNLYEGSTSDYANWRGTSSISFVPENAVAISVFMYYSNYDYLYEVQLFDEGYYTDHKISNIQATNITSYGAQLSWDKTSDVSITKIYQDGEFVADVEGTSYTISSGLVSNTQYIYTFEPVTSNTSDERKNVKETLKLKTKSEDVEFYVDGYDNYARRHYYQMFDKDLSTGCSFYGYQPTIIKWKGNLKGKQILVKTNFSPNGSRVISFIDENNEVIEVYRPDGTKTNYINYQAGESYTFVPDNAVAIRSYLYYSNYDTIYEIQVLEDGRNNNQKYLSNFKATDIGTYSLKLQWDKTDDVISTKIFQDQVLLDEVTDNEYYIDSNLISNTEYTYTIEPITADTTENFKNMKETIKVKTKTEDVEFYVDGYEDYSRKLYKGMFDKDLSTGCSRYSYTPMIIKWHGDVTGKQLYLKTNFSPNGSRKIYYLDEEGNIIKVRQSNGLETEYINWNGTETITQIPSNAVAIGCYMYYSNYDTIYEVQVMEDGWFNTKQYISSVNAQNITPFSVKLKWTVDSSVTSTKIYQDGIFLTEVTGNEYVVDSNLIASSDYIYTLEPITSNVTENRKNKKRNIKVRTASQNVEFYVDGYDGQARRYFKEMFDNNLETGNSFYSYNPTIIRWTGNAAGKKLTFKINFGYNGSRIISFIDSDGNRISVDNGNGQMVDYINWNAGENTVTIPNNAVGISCYMYYSNYDTIYNVSIKD